MSVLEDAGWHLSYFGDEKAVAWKMASFAHGRPEYTAEESWQSLPGGGEGPENSFDEISRVTDKIVELNFNLPRIVIQQPLKYRDLLLPS